MSEPFELFKGDCLEVMNGIESGSVDLVLCDLPFGTTAHKWDSIIPYDKLWEHYHRIVKNDGVVVLFATQPFTSTLICSNLEEWRYNWIWEKESANGFLNSAYAPLKKTEDICVFSKATVGSLSKNPIKFFIEREEGKMKRNNPNSKFRKNSGYDGLNNKLNSNKEYVSHSNVPSNILKCKRDSEKFHPTQKPIELLKKLIGFYTKEGDVVLDNCLGSGSTCVASLIMKRKFIGIEKDENYFEIAKKRIEEYQKDIFSL